MLALVLSVLGPGVAMFFFKEKCCRVPVLGGTELGLHLDHKILRPKTSYQMFEHIRRILNKIYL